MISEIPAHFASNTDDIFMRSMISTYAIEDKTNNKFLLNKPATFQAANEVLKTHKGLRGAARKEYLQKYFNKTWAHFDVNKEGVIDVQKAPQFMRFLANDQRMSLGENGF